MKANIKSIKDDINKAVGQNALISVKDYDKFEGAVISSGSLGIDIATGIGGFPCGRIVEIYGPESSGKTTIALQAIAQAQKAGGIAAFIDAEHAIDLTYAEALGIDTENLLLSQPDNGEQAFEIIDKLVKRKVHIIVVDSVAALTPKSEIEGNYGDSKMGLHARLMSQAMRKLTAQVNKGQSCLIFINQIRMKIGVLYGNPEVTTGGNALKFYASMRLDIRRKETPNAENKEANAHSSDTRCRVIKNKCAPPFRKCKFEIEFGVGVNIYKELLDHAVDADIIKKSGSWFSYEGTKIGQGKDGVEDLFKDNTELFDEIYDLVLKHHDL